MSFLVFLPVLHLVILAVPHVCHWYSFLRVLLVSVLWFFVGSVRSLSFFRTLFVFNNWFLGVPPSCCPCKRGNLKFTVVRKTTKDGAIADIARRLKKEFAQQSGIVYCFSKSDCELLTKRLGN
jgi:hypothetical protein